MLIVGAGLAGLLAGNMLRRFNPEIIEAQGSLPNNHSALLRFRSDACSIAFSVPFKKVKVQKAVKYDGKLLTKVDLRIMNLYSEKVTGEYMSRSIEHLEPVERYIAPPNLIEQAATQLNIKYDVKFNTANLLTPDIKISTMPMNMMMDLVGWSDQPEFNYLPIHTIVLNINSMANLHQTIYYPEINSLQYRASITGNQMIIECISDPLQANLKTIIDGVFEDFGLVKNYSAPAIKFQKYGKLLPIDEKIRKRFMLHLTEKYNVYSLGRFATWRQLLLDDLVNDVNVIEGLMDSSGYDRIKRSVA